MTLQGRNNTDDNTMTCPEYYCDPELNEEESCPIMCYKTCPDICKSFFAYPPPPPPLLDAESNSSRSISTNLIIMAGVLGGAFLLGVCWVIVLNFYSKWKTSRRVNSPVLDDTHEDFLDGNHGPEAEHHIWYINSVGLQQSVIDSIKVCKFKKDEGLIEGTECSVCLSEFQENDTLRLLPKCSHAFHLPCIDTWLRSHKNCPLCRAPIVHESVTTTVTGVVNSNSESHGGLGNDQMIGTNEVRSRTEDSDASSPIEMGRISEILKKGSPFCEFRVQSDLADNHRVPKQELQPVRRSVSLDSSSASVIYRAMANVVEHDGSSGSQLV